MHLLLTIITFLMLGFIFLPMIICLIGALFGEILILLKLKTRIPYDPSEPTDWGIVEDIYCEWTEQSYTGEQEYKSGQ